MTKQKIKSNLSNTSNEHDKLLKLVEGYDCVTCPVVFKFKRLTDEYDINSAIPDNFASLTSRSSDALYGFIGIKNIIIVINKSKYVINPIKFTELNPLNLLNLQYYYIYFELDNSDGIAKATEVFYNSDIRYKLHGQSTFFLETLI